MHVSVNTSESLILIAECILKAGFNAIISLVCCCWKKSKQTQSLDAKL